MKALRWYGKNDVRVESVAEPEIVNPHDALIKVTRAAICGSDLHMYNGWIPAMQSGDILGHEFMGEVIAVGSAVADLRVGDRVVVPFNIACGRCWFCQNEYWSLCDNTNPNGYMVEQAYGQPTAGLFGYSHMTGGYAGGQAQFVRVPFADVGCVKVDDALSDERALFVGDILSTAYQAAENCNIKPGDTVAVWGLGPVGQLTVKCAYFLGAERVIGIDDVPERLTMAASQGAAEIVDLSETRVLEKIKELTGGRGPDACVDAVGMEAHGVGIDETYDRMKQTLRLQNDRPAALRYAIMACRKGGTVSTPGVYGGLIDKVPFGAAFQKGLTIRTGQTHVHRYVKPLLEHIMAGALDPTFIITHRISLDEAPDAYRMFNDKKDGCVKVVLEL